jgi:hypothetical protein
MILFIFIAAAAAAAIVVDYPAQQMGLGWIQITLRSPHLVSVQRVDWCKSGDPNNADPPPPDIAECEARNLLHLQLFPSNKHYLRDPPEAEPNTLYIDADDLGGWDTRHQMNIIVEGDKGAFRQVIRFNPLHAPPPSPTPTPTEEEPTTTEQTTEQTTEKEITAIPTPPPAPTASVVVVEVLSKRHPWIGTGIFLGSGLVFIALVTVLLRWRQTRNDASQRGVTIAEATRYQWSASDPPPGVEIEMVDLSASH